MKISDLSFLFEIVPRQKSEQNARKMNVNARAFLGVLQDGCPKFLDR